MSESSSKSHKGGDQSGHQNSGKTQLQEAALRPFKGIEVQVRLTHGANIGFSEEGDRKGLLYGRLKADPNGRPVELFVKIDDTCPALRAGRVVVFTRGKDQEILVQASNHRGGKTTYRQTVQISRAHGGKQVSVDQTTNNLYIAFVTPSYVVIKGIALVWQDGNFFLLAQDQYQVEAFKTNTGKMELPGFNEPHGGLPTFLQLPEVVQFIDSVSQELIQELDHISSYRAHMLKLDRLERDDLVVKLWTLRRGNGVGVLKNGQEVRIHWKDILGTGPKALRTGQVVHFHRLEPITPEQRRNQRTALEWDARGLTLRP